jgi:hypothetical protein
MRLGATGHGIDFIGAERADGIRGLSHDLLLWVDAARGLFHRRWEKPCRTVTDSAVTRLTQITAKT